jgi:hypothetical protein
MRESWVAKNVRTVADMVSYCPTFWEICGLEYSDPATDYLINQPEARKHTKESNLLYFSEESNDPEDSENLKVRKRKTRQDWIEARPLATVLHDTEIYEIRNVGTGHFLPEGLITVIVEKNVFDENGRLLGDADMPSEASANEWINQISNLQEELHQISSQNRIPETNTAFPNYYLFIKNSRMGIPPHFSTLSENRTFGAHYIGAIHLFYGIKN